MEQEFLFTLGIRAFYAHRLNSEQKKKKKMPNINQKKLNDKIKTIFLFHCVPACSYAPRSQRFAAYITNELVSVCRLALHHAAADAAFGLLGPPPSIRTNVKQRAPVICKWWNNENTNKRGLIWAVDGRRVR